MTRLRGVEGTKMKTQLHDSIPLERQPTQRFCKMCQKGTPHEIRRISDSSVRFCVPCLERAGLNELDRRLSPTA